MGQERDGTQSSQALAVIAQNIDLAADEEALVFRNGGPSEDSGFEGSDAEADAADAAAPLTLASLPGSRARYPE